MRVFDSAVGQDYPGPAAALVAHRRYPMSCTRVIASLLFVLAPLAACGGGPSLESPRAVAETMARAMTAGDVELAMATLPPVAALEAHFDCPPEASLVERRDRNASRIGRSLSDEDAAGIEVAIAAFDLEGSKSEAIGVGETWRGCTAKKTVRVHTSRLTLKLTRGGEVDDDGETWVFVELDGQWYFGR